MTLEPGFPANTVEFMENRPRGEILDVFRRAKAAIHTMKDEHFGITIVEMMSAGLVTIAHSSAGPLYDIIGKSSDPVGYLADDKQSYIRFLAGSMRDFDNSYHQKLRK